MTWKTVGLVAVSMWWCTPALAQDLREEVDAIGTEQDLQYSEILELKGKNTLADKERGGLAQAVADLQAYVDGTIAKLQASVDANTKALAQLMDEEPVPTALVTATLDAKGVPQAVTILEGRTTDSAGLMPQVALGANWSDKEWDAATLTALAILAGKSPTACFDTTDASATDLPGILDDGTKVSVCVVDCGCGDDLKAGQIAIAPLRFLAMSDRAQGIQYAVNDGTERRIGLCCMMP